MRSITGVPQNPQLAEIMDAVWERQLERSIFLRRKLGLPIETLPRFTLAQARQDATFARNQLTKLDALDENQLSHDDRLSVGLLRYQLGLEDEGAQFHWLTSPITPYASPLPGVHQAFTSFLFVTADDLARYEALLSEYVRLQRDVRNHIAGQIERGILLPQPELAVVIPFLQAFVGAGEESLFYVGDERLAPVLETVGSAGLQAFQERVRTAIDAEINPQYTQILFTLSGPYESQAPEDLGLAQYPDGEEYYRFLVRLHTTLDVTPEEVHQRGVEEVARIEGLMAKAQKRMGSASTRSVYHNLLRSQPHHKATSAEQIGERLMEGVAEIEPRIDELFLRLPEAPYGVQALPDSLAGAMTYGYYQSPTSTEPKGIYYFNGSQPEERSLLWAKSLIFHELVPGHHFQLALQYENEAAHPLRRFGLSTAFVEGWAEYASELGNDLGLYQGIDLYGRYVAEIFLASRLVVDTGLHHYGWSRQQAIEYMRDHTLESPTQIATETLRYGIDIPAQALAYKMGALEIQRLRAKAEKTLGDRFDVRRFHDALLQAGALPLPVIAHHIDWWIEQELAGNA